MSNDSTAAGASSWTTIGWLPSRGCGVWLVRTSGRRGAIDRAREVEAEAPVAVRPETLERGRVDRRAEPGPGRHDEVAVRELALRRCHVGGVEARADVVGRERQRGQHCADMRDRG